MSIYYFYMAPYVLVVESFFVSTFRFFLPIRPLYIRTVEEDGQFRGYCFVDFASKADLVAAMEKNNAFLLNRRVTMRIADQVGSADLQVYSSILLPHLTTVFASFRMTLAIDADMATAMVLILVVPITEGNLSH